MLHRIIHVSQGTFYCRMRIYLLWYLPVYFAATCTFTWVRFWMALKGTADPAVLFYVLLWPVFSDPFQNWIHLSIKSLVEKCDGSGGGIEAERSMRRWTGGIAWCPERDWWTLGNLAAWHTGAWGSGRGRGAGRARHGTGWHGATDKVPHGHWVPQFWLKEPTSVLTPHLCPLVMCVCSWMSHCGPFSRGQFEPEKAGCSWF